MKNQNNKKVNISKDYGFFKKLLAFVGPAYLISVGYMDPGNWATDIAGGSKFGYTLIWVILLSNIMALVFQSLSVNLGIVTGKDLAQACRAHYRKEISYVLWILCEIAIIATDIAEVLGSAIGINLIFHIPLTYCVLITGADTLILLLINSLGIKKMEAFIMGLISIIGLSFLFEVFISKPDYHSILMGFIPSLPNNEALYIGIGIIGATIMPHNLYLHSSLVQTRNFERTDTGIKQAIKFNIIDTIVALNLAFFVNAGILIMAAAVFYKSGNYGVADIQQAYKLLQPILGNKIAPIIFGVALIASGQSSTITGTYAGQIVMEGFINIRLQPWVRRIITRSLAIIPSLFTIIYFGESYTGALLILSQVVLSLQLSFAIIPLIHFVGSKSVMKKHVISWKLKIVSWILAVLIMVLNIKLVFDTFNDWISGGNITAIIYIPVLAIALALGVLLFYMIFEPIFSSVNNSIEKNIHGTLDLLSISEITPYKKIALALDFGFNDKAVISHGVNMCKDDTTLVLIHVVESVGASLFGRNIRDRETIKDTEMITQYADALKKLGVKNVITEIEYGNPTNALSYLIKKHNVDIIILGTHGHKGLSDLIFGTVTNKIKHKVSIPILIAR